MGIFESIALETLKRMIVKGGEIFMEKTFHRSKSSSITKRRRPIRVSRSSIQSQSYQQPIIRSVVYQQPVTRPTVLIPISKRKKRNNKWKKYGWPIAISCLTLFGAWLWYEYLDQGSPKTLVKGYYNCIGLGLYQQAWQKIAPFSKERTYPGGFSQFEEKWKAYSEMKVRDVSISTERETSAQLSILLYWKGYPRSTQYEVVAQCDLWRDSVSGKWFILNWRFVDM